MRVTTKQQHDGTRSPGGVDCAGDDPFELKAQLVDFARELGFDSCRITSCAVTAHTQEFQNWLRAGAHGEIKYMERGEE